LPRFGPMITCQREVFHEKAFGRATRSRDSLRRRVIGRYAGVRVRRLWPERPSQLGGRLRLGRPRSSLVPETHGPSSRSRSQWGDDLLQVSRLPSAPPSPRAAPDTSCDAARISSNVGFPPTTSERTHRPMSA
jgi:hypothetical protein